MPTLIAFSGSDRKESKNTQVLRHAVRAAEEAGVTVDHIRLSDYQLPLYDGDWEDENGLPEGCTRLKELFKPAAGFLIASPEYNSGYTPLLKNAIDWVSRPREGEKPLECFSGKVAGLVAASPGWRAGMRGLFQIRSVLQNINVIVTPTIGTLANYTVTMNDKGDITDQTMQNVITQVGTETAGLAKQLHL
ncbi:MAG: NAD(P)H-dependent oxidoreductase [Planctomycetota bacterium]